MTTSNLYSACFAVKAWTVSDHIAASSIYLPICTYIHTHIHTYMCLSLCVSICTCTCTYMYTHVHRAKNQTTVASQPVAQGSPATVQIYAKSGLWGPFPSSWPR